jgi:hypothetical protein
MCVSGRHDHDGQSGEADQHPYSEASKSIYALSPGGWIERFEEEAVVALWAATVRLLRTGNPDKWPF